jgi:type I restriction enzyme S subunit
MFLPGDVICTTRGPKLKVATVDFRGLGAHTNFVLRTRDPEVLSQPFLEAVVRSEGFQQHLAKHFRGSVNLFVNWSDAALYEFDLPPIAAQRRASIALSTIAAHSEAATVLETAARTVNYALLLDAISGAPMVTVVDLLEHGPQNGVSPAVAEDGTHPTLPIGAVRDGEVDTSTNLKWAHLDIERYDRFLLKPGDILCVRGNGNRNLVGRVGVVTDNTAGCFYPDLLVRLRFRTDKILPDFAVAAWNSGPIHAALIARAKSTNGIFKINGADIRAHSLPVPDICLQQAFLDRAHDIKLAAKAASTRAQRSRDLGKLVLAAM